MHHYNTYNQSGYESILEDPANSYIVFPRANGIFKQDNATFHMTKMSDMS